MDHKALGRDAALHTAILQQFKATSAGDFTFELASHRDVLGLNIGAHIGALGNMKRALANDGSLYLAFHTQIAGGVVGTIEV